MKINKVSGYCLSSQYGDGKVFGQPLGVKSIGIIEVVTDEGLVGIGETYSAVYVPELIEPTVKFIESLIVGMNPIEIEKVYESMNIPFVAMNGFIRTVVGAIEMALWDIKGQVEQKPLYKLLSETNINDFDVYSSGGSVAYTPDEIKKDIEKRKLRWSTVPQNMWVNRYHSAKGEKRSKRHKIVNVSVPIVEKHVHKFNAPNSKIK